MRLLYLISWPHVRNHALRSALTALGISLGVAVFVGMNSANQSVLGAFSQTVDRIAGKTQLQVSAGEAGFPEEVLDEVQSMPSVGIAVPVIEAVADTKIRGEGSLLILGVDFTGDRSLRDYDLESGEDAVVDDPLVFLAQRDSIIVSTSFAQKNQLTVGSQLALGTIEGEKRFTIRGIMKTGGLTSAFGGNLAVMDIYAAQKMFGRGRTFDRIDLAVAPGTAIADARREIEGRLGPGYQVETPASRGQHFEAMIVAYSVMMRASSLFAMFIGMFIIYNAFSIAVTERRAEIGILRALGATRGQIQRLFLIESAIAGVAGSLIGLVAGMLIARVIAAAIGTLISSASGVAQSRGDVTIEPIFLVIAMGIGIATSLCAAFVPARAAARVDPVEALQKGTHQRLSTRESHVRAVAAAVFAVLSVACLIFGRSRALFYSSYLLVIIVAVLMTPALCVWLARLLRPLLKWLRPVEGTLAADSLVQSPRRTSACVAALMLSLALVIAFGGMARASFGSIVDWADTVLNPDVFVLPSPQVTTRSIRFPESMAAELAAIPGVAHVQMVRQARVLFRGTPVMLMSLQFSNVAQTTNLKVAAGDQREMFRAASAGEGLLVSENLAENRGLRLGDILELPSPAGLLRLPIVGIVIDYLDQQGVILLDRTVYQKYWRDDSVNLFRLYFTPGARFEDVKQRILERYAGQRQVFVLANAEMKSYILGLAGQWFRMTYVQIAVAVLIAILGIVNTLTVSITDRRRELGVLRAVGGLQRQVKQTIWLEAIGMAVLGLVLGGALGSVNLYFVLRIIRQDVIGMHFPYRFPVSILLGLVPLMLVVAFVAAWWPAKAAMRGSLVEALSYE
jgi:putative ABC transport system permease protein